MSLDLITPEYLHKDELQYELKARGLSTEGSNVAILRSLFRPSRDLKENSENYLLTKYLRTLFLPFPFVVSVLIKSRI
jgi:hypothetical protein